MKYRYHYRNKDTKQPLNRCPFCNANLTKGKGVLLEVTGEEECVQSRLTAKGRLENTPGNEVKEGMVQEAFCGECWESLLDHCNTTVHVEV